MGYDNSGIRFPSRKLRRMLEVDMRKDPEDRQG